MVKPGKVRFLCPQGHKVTSILLSLLPVLSKLFCISLWSFTVKCISRKLTIIDHSLHMVSFKSKCISKVT